MTPGVKQRFCSGTLIAPRAVVSAAHCLGGVLSDAGITADQIWVSFDPVYDPAVSTLYHGTMVTDGDPGAYVGGSGYQGKFGNSNGYDIAVVHLDEAPPITPARLPTAGLLSSLDLRGQAFTTVGYGRTRVDQTGGPNSIEPNFFRTCATSRPRSSGVCRRISSPCPRIRPLAMAAGATATRAPRTSSATRTSQSRFPV